MNQWIDISPHVLPITEVHEFLAQSEGGGISVFVGTTRKNTGGKVTTHLSYDAHDTMAIKEMQRLVDVASEQWPLLRSVLLHRTGEVPVGQASVIVGVATAHRVEAFEACRFLIDELKKSVPIWKKENYENGGEEWIGDEWQTQ